MNVLFVHQNFPAQFGHIAKHLIQTHGWSCTFLSNKVKDGEVAGIKTIPYQLKNGARESTHYCSRSFENAIWQTSGVYEACKARPELKPDLIVGHSGFGSTLFLSELYPDVPIINYLEFFYHTRDSDLDFRPEFPPVEMDRLRAKARNAMIVLDLLNCQAGYSPTRYQWSLFPEEFRDRIRVIFDGVDTSVFRRKANVSRQIGRRTISDSTRIVTYCSRGFEAMRGFDIFMKVAKRIYEQYPDVIFIVVGSDRICYGGDKKYIKHDSFREHVMAQDQYDITKFIFTGTVPTLTLIDYLSLSNLHIYFTVPFVLSWSLMNALACGCPVLASNTAPVAEMIKAGENGLLADFYDVDGFVDQALQVLKDPGAFQPLADRGLEMIREKYALDVTLPQMVSFFEETASAGTRSRA